MEEEDPRRSAALNTDLSRFSSSIMYTAIHRAQPLRRNFQLSYVTGEGNEATLHVKMATSGQAGAVYRAVTERHAFYCCETVRTDVTEQFIRDLKVIIMLRENFAVQLWSGVVLTLHSIMPVFVGVTNATNWGKDFNKFLLVLLELCSLLCGENFYFG